MRAAIVGAQYQRAVAHGLPKPEKNIILFINHKNCTSANEVGNYKVDLKLIQKQPAGSVKR